MDIEDAILIVLIKHIERFHIGTYKQALIKGLKGDWDKIIEQARLLKNADDMIDFLKKFKK